MPVAIKWPSQRFQKVKVKVGPLIYFQEEGKIKRKALEENSSRIMQAIKSIMPYFELKFLRRAILQVFLAKHAGFCEVKTLWISPA